MPRLQLHVEIEDELRQRPGRSDRYIGAALGCDGKTVATVRRRLESQGVIPQSSARTGLDGRTRGGSPDPTPRAPAPALRRRIRPDVPTCPNCGKHVFWQSLGSGGSWYCSNCRPPINRFQVLQEIDYGR